MERISLYCGDCLAELDALPDGAVNLCFVDPPYNIGVFCKMEPGEYLAWCEQWIALCSRKLAANGAFWVSHSVPDVLVDISRIIARYGRQRINWVTWDKYEWAYVRKFEEAGSRSFIDANEYLIYHADEGQWTTQCDKERGFIFEPLRAYLASEWERAGLGRRDLNLAVGTAATGGGMASHYLGTTTQWALPTLDHYQAMRAYANSHNHGGEYLRREYEDLRRESSYLRREYEDLRYTFNNPGRVSSVWQIPPAKRNGHLTPKPEALLERIIETTSNPGDVVLDPMMGSGTTGAVALRLGRSFVGCEIKPSYFKQAQQRIEAAQSEMVQARMPV